MDYFRICYAAGSFETSPDPLIQTDFYYIKIYMLICGISLWTKYFYWKKIRTDPSWEIRHLMLLFCLLWHVHFLHFKPRNFPPKHLKRREKSFLNWILLFLNPFGASRSLSSLSKGKTLIFWPQQSKLFLVVLGVGTHTEIKLLSSSLEFFFICFSFI